MYLILIFQIIIGYLIADFIVALFHWFEDTYLEYNKNNSIINEIALDNLIHHFYPRMIVIFNFFENIKISLFISCIVIFVFYLINKKFVIKYRVFFFIFGVFTTISNFIHKLAHQREHENNLFVQFMQKYGLILSHKEHSHHHHINSKIKYGVLNDYTNYIYDGIGIWRIFEKIIDFLTGIKPNHKKTIQHFYKYYDNILFDAVISEYPRKLTKKECIFYTNKLKEYL